LLEKLKKSKEKRVVKEEKKEEVVRTNPFDNIQEE